MALDDSQGSRRVWADDTARLLLALPDKQAAAVTLYYDGCVSLAEIGRSLQMNREETGSTLAAGLVRLGELLQGLPSS